jgi:hypothetical protein
MAYTDTATAISCGACEKMPRSAEPFACGLIVIVDFFWVLSIAGFFAGTLLFLVAGPLLIAGAWLGPAASTRSAVAPTSLPPS